MPDLEPWFRKFEKELHFMVRRRSGEPDICLGLIRHFPSDTDSIQTRMESLSKPTLPTRTVNRYVIEVAAQLAHILDRQPLFVANGPKFSKEGGSHARYANGVFAFYYITGRLGLIPNELPERVLRSICELFYHVKPGRAHDEADAARWLTVTLWFMEAMLRPKWIGSGYRWRATALEPFYFPRD